MFATRKRIIIPVAALTLVGLIAGAAYLLKIPPFAQQGSINANDACASLGSSQNAVSALKKVLPVDSHYSFDDTPGTRVGQEDRSYTSSCFVNGGERTILSARVQMMRAEPAEGWVRSEVLGYKTGVQDLESFAAGDKGVTTPTMAAIFVPCAPAGQIPGGAYNLSVIVELKEHGESSDTETRRGLMDLALGVSDFAHRKARCGLPAKLSNGS
ncbi:hypothetical protein [Streptomyces sp. NPDC051776]|uniref:hypothetical protein n=1 Tax=Streptomyces sp. NPDC051776 TaxID=3155414 RepID=UPI003414050F